MTDVKKLRKLAEGETPTLSYADNAPYWEYILATNPQAIIEILDRLERYEKALEYYGFKLVPDSLNSGKTTITTDTGRVAREALEGGS